MAFQITPYFWLFGIDGDIRAASGQGPTVDVDASPSDVLENLDYAGMVVARARYGSFGVLADASFGQLSTEGDTEGPFFSGADVEMDLLISTLAGTYRAWEDGGSSVDLLAGARIWDLETVIEFQPGIRPARRVESDKSWVDPVVGATAELPLSGGFSIVAYGDIGGFGVGSDYTWQSYGGFGWQFSGVLAAHAGYRALFVDRDNDDLDVDAVLHGFLLGLEIRF